MLGDRVGDILTGPLVGAEHAGDGERDDRRVIDRSQLDPADALGEGSPSRVRGRERQPGLAGATGPGEGQQTAAGKGGHHVAELALTTDQRAQLHREPTGGQRCHSRSTFLLDRGSFAHSLTGGRQQPGRTDANCRPQAGGEQDQQRP